MKRIVLGLTVAGAVALLAPQASAEETCVQYGRTPYQRICLYPR